MNKEVKRYDPLAGLARNAKLRRMEMQCDPQWVLDLLAERDRLRETLNGFPGFLCGTATGDKWIEQKRAALQGAQP